MTAAKVREISRAALFDGSFMHRLDTERLRNRPPQGCGQENIVNEGQGEGGSRQEGHGGDQGQSGSGINPPTINLEGHDQSGSGGANLPNDDNQGDGGARGSRQQFVNVSLGAPVVDELTAMAHERYQHIHPMIRQCILGKPHEKGQRVLHFRHPLLLRVLIKVLTTFLSAHPHLRHLYGSHRCLSRMILTSIGGLVSVLLLSNNLYAEFMP